MGKFYRKISDNELEERKIVKARLYTLRPEDKDKSNLPDDWYWFEKEIDAYIFFQIDRDIWNKIRVKKLLRMRHESIVELLNKVTPGYVPEAFIDRELDQGVRRMKKSSEESFPPIWRGLKR